MGSVLKGYRYRLIDNRSFEIPLPIKYEVLKEDDPVAAYEIGADEKVTVDILTKHKENLITPVNRSLDMSDIYFLFSSRVFQNGTPFTAPELQLMGLDRYNVYEIIRKTRGITPYDTYWFRFDGDECDYSTARSDWESLMTKTPSESDAPPAVPTAAAVPPARSVEVDVSDILGQHKVNVSEKIAEHAPAPAEVPKSNGGKMSQEDIEKLLATASNEPAPEPVPAEEPKSNGGKMSQEEIEKLLATASNEPAPEPAPAEEPKSNGGKMSQEDIEKLLATASNEPAPAPAEEPKSNGGKMSQEDIEKLLATASNEPAPEPVPAEEPKSNGGMMSQEDIEALLNGMKDDISK